MYERIFQIDQLEWLEVQEILDKHQIPFTLINSKEDSVFPVLNARESIIQFGIPDKYSSKFYRLINKDYPSVIVVQNESSSKSRSKRYSTLFALYGIIMTLLFFRYYYISERGSIDKNYTYTWSYSNQIMYAVHKGRDHVEDIYYDKNYDNNFEKVESYFNETRISESFDNNEDGFFEEVKLYDLAGRPSGGYFDTNKDGLFDRMKIVLENNEELLLVDSNNNGRYELK